VSAPVLFELGLVDAFLPPRIYRALQTDEGGETLDEVRIAGRRARIGFRALGTPRDEVLGLPRLPDERPPMSEGDLTYALLLVTLIGLGGAAGFARTAARTLAEPVRALRAAAETVGRGQTPAPFGPEVPEEFVPVADAFTRMATDVRSSQAALEAARRRTVAVLRNVATGVVALDRNLQVTLANPRAEELLGIKLDPDTPVSSGSSGEWGPVWSWVREFLASNSDLAGQEFTVAGRRIRAQVSALGTEGGCVVALDDVTQLAHAVRVLAWGEIARQVAHEIKNPLTPMRLGIQHLQRVRAEPKQDFDQVLDRTSRQILAEIDRLDAVARAFARFGAPPAPQDPGPLGPVDLVAVARETAALYALGGGAGVELVTDGVVKGVARPDELREVLVNLVENARNAAATRIVVTVGEVPDSRVVVSVRDNGKGIRTEDLPLIFEPHFSTTTSGTGLGLAICKRLVESWGGKISAESTVGQGTTVTLEIAAG
jgi:nitrogen fixation/metabolism regulation signal transduction histidine kinase